MAELFEVIGNCRKAIRKEIYKVSPAGSLPGKFSAHKTRSGPLMTTVEKPRKFDVICSDVAPQTITWGASTNDRDVTMNIVIGYGVNEDWNELAQSDYLAITDRLHDFDNSSVSGLATFRVDGYEWKSNDDFRYMIITVVARITTTDQ